MRMAADGRYLFEIHCAKLSCAPTLGNVNARRCVVAAINDYKYLRMFGGIVIILSPTVVGGICDMFFYTREGCVLLIVTGSSSSSPTFLTLGGCRPPNA